VSASTESGAGAVWSAVAGRARRIAAGPALADFAPSRECPPAPPQQRLLTTEALRPGGGAHNLLFAYRLRGALDVGALERALASAWARHDGLRSHFPGEGVQRFHSPDGLALQQAGDGSGGIEWARREAAALGAQPFALRRDPLLRAVLYAYAPEQWLLVLVVHHIVFDAWSLDLLHRELGSVYAQGSAELPELRASYSQYAAWQHARLEDPAVRAPQHAFWVEYLDGRPPLARIPGTARGGGSVPGRRRTMSRPLHAAVVDASRSLAADSGASLYAVLAAAFAVHVSRRTGERDFVVLTPSAGRPAPALHDLIGYFVELHPLRANLERDQSFRAMVAAAASGLGQIAAHAELPTEALASLYGAAAGAAPLLFGLQNTPARPLQLAGLEVSVEQLDAGEADFGLYVNVVPDPDGGLAVTATYDDARLDGDEIAATLEAYAAVLRECVAEPDAVMRAGQATSQAIDAAPATRGSEPPQLSWPLEELRDHVAALAATPAATVNVERGLLELGLDSLKLIELAARVRRELELDAPLALYAAAPSLRSLAEDLLLLRCRSDRLHPDGAVDVFEF
jgi:aryl carrier-like protein